jgi:DNA polymerase-3 subunit gamma/tau
VDIIEIDAASNRGIDEIRELREAVRTAPFSSPYKVYIVDEAHMLTKDAANALLKTLEEPPSHVIFILATTDPEKLPPTIISRCQKVVFKQPDVKTLSDKLIDVAKKEGHHLDEESAILVARHSKGSYRDGLGILEQILAISEKTIKYETVVSVLGTPLQELLINLLEAVCLKKAKDIVDIIEKLQTDNISPIRTYDEFLELIRKVLLVRVGEDKKKAEIGELSRLASTYPLIVGSKMLLELLENRHLLEVSDAHAWTAFLAILFSLTD